jgi:hypothetical protein
MLFISVVAAADGVKFGVGSLGSFGTLRETVEGVDRSDVVDVVEIRGIGNYSLLIDLSMSEKKKESGARHDLPKYVERAYMRLVSQGMSPVQASGVVGNLIAESGMRSDIWNLEGSKAFGVQQWMGPRLSNIRRVYGTENPTFDQQIEYVYDEYSGKYPGLGWNYVDRGRYNKSSGYYNYSKREFDASETPEQAAVAWNQGFGRPGRHELRNDSRARYAREVYDMFGNQGWAGRGFDGMDGMDGTDGTDGIVGTQGTAGMTGFRGMTGFYGSNIDVRGLMSGIAGDVEGANGQASDYALMRADIERKNREMQFVMSLVERMHVPLERRTRGSESGNSRIWGFGERDVGGR